MSFSVYLALSQWQAVDLGSPAWRANGTWEYWDQLARNYADLTGRKPKPHRLKPLLLRLHSKQSDCNSNHFHARNVRLDCNLFIAGKSLGGNSCREVLCRRSFRRWFVPCRPACRARQG